MLLNGSTIQLKNEVLVIPKGNQQFVFEMAPVLSMELFEKKFKKPEPPLLQTPGNKPIIGLDDPEYLAELTTYRNQAWDWRIITSLLATPGLKFETVNLDDPTTFANWSKEFSAAGFSDLEIQHITTKVMDACGMNSSKIEEATQAFLLSREKAQAE